MREAYLRALQRAVQVYGMNAVASLVACPEYQIRAWLAGKSSIPDGVFLSVVDLIAADDRGSTSHGDASEFRVITSAEFLAFSRAEKLSYLRSAIHAHQQFAQQKARQAERREQELLGIAPRTISAENSDHTQRQDDVRINPDSEVELNYWCGKLGVSRDELRNAVQVAGPMLKNVQRHLGS